GIHTKPDEFLPHGIADDRHEGGLAPDESLQSIQHSPVERIKIRPVGRHDECYVAPEQPGHQRCDQPLWQQPVRMNDVDPMAPAKAPRHPGLYKDEAWDKHILPLSSTQIGDNAAVID